MSLSLFVVFVPIAQWALFGKCPGPAFGPQRVALSTDFAAAVISMGIIATAVGIWVQTWAQRRTSAVRTALIIALEPVFATAWSIWRGREAFDARVLEGGGLILAGIVVCELFKKREP